MSWTKGSFSTGAGDLYTNQSRNAQKSQAQDYAAGFQEDQRRKKQQALDAERAAQRNRRDRAGINITGWGEERQGDLAADYRPEFFGTTYDDYTNYMGAYNKYAPMLTAEQWKTRYPGPYDQAGAHETSYYKTMGAGAPDPRDGLGSWIESHPIYQYWPNRPAGLSSSGYGAYGAYGTLGPAMDSGLDSGLGAYDSTLGYGTPGDPGGQRLPPIGQTEFSPTFQSNLDQAQALVDTVPSLGFSSDFLGDLGTGQEFIRGFNALTETGGALEALREGSFGAGGELDRINALLAARGPDSLYDRVAGLEIPDLAGQGMAQLDRLQEDLARRGNFGLDLIGGERGGGAQLDQLRKMVDETKPSFLDPGRQQLEALGEQIGNMEGRIGRLGVDMPKGLEEIQALIGGAQDRIRGLGQGPQPEGLQGILDQIRGAQGLIQGLGEGVSVDDFLPSDQEFADALRMRRPDAWGVDKFLPSGSQFEQQLGMRRPDAFGVGDFLPSGSQFEQQLRMRRPDAWEAGDFLPAGSQFEQQLGMRRPDAWEAGDFLPTAEDLTDELGLRQPGAFEFEDFIPTEDQLAKLENLVDLSNRFAGHDILNRGTAQLEELANRVSQFQGPDLLREGVGELGQLKDLVTAFRGPDILQRGTGQLEALSDRVDQFAGPDVLGRGKTQLTELEQLLSALKPPILDRGRAQIDQLGKEMSGLVPDFSTPLSQAESISKLLGNVETPELGGLSALIDDIGTRAKGVEKMLTDITPPDDFTQEQLLGLFPDIGAGDLGLPGLEGILTEMGLRGPGAMENLLGLFPDIGVADLDLPGQEAILAGLGLTSQAGKATAGTGGTGGTGGAAGEGVTGTDATSQIQKLQKILMDLAETDPMAVGEYDKDLLLRKDEFGEDDPIYKAPEGTLRGDPITAALLSDLRKETGEEEARRIAQLQRFGALSSGDAIDRMVDLSEGATRAEYDILSRAAERARADRETGLGRGVDLAGVAAGNEQAIAELIGRTVTGDKTLGGRQADLDVIAAITAILDPDLELGAGATRSKLARSILETSGWDEATQVQWRDAFGIDPFRVDDEGGTSGGTGSGSDADIPEIEGGPTNQKIQISHDGKVIGGNDENLNRAIEHFAAENPEILGHGSYYIDDGKFYNVDGRLIARWSLENNKWERI